MIAKQLYSSVTGRALNRDNDVLAYQILQSFQPGEVTPEQANEIGRELAMKLSKGGFQFVVATHVDKGHPHNHIVLNSTSLDGTRKYRNAIRSEKTVRRFSDQICAAHGLSVIANPASKGKSYKEWMEAKKGTSWKAVLQENLLSCLQSASDFPALVAAMESLGYEAKENGKLYFRAPGQQRFMSTDTFGDGYRKAEILARLSSRKGKLPTTDREEVGRVIDLSSGKNAAKGSGFSLWAARHNLKMESASLVFMEEHGLEDYAALSERLGQAAENMERARAALKETESRIRLKAKLKDAILQYGKTKTVYQQYRAGGYKQAFYQQHEGEILLHKAAKKTFDELGLSKLPGVKAVQSDLTALYSRKKEQYSEFQNCRKAWEEYRTVKNNLSRLIEKPIDRPAAKEKQR